MPNSAYFDKTRKYPCITKQKHVTFQGIRENISATQKCPIYAPNRKYFSSVVNRSYNPTSSTQIPVFVVCMIPIYTLAILREIHCEDNVAQE